MSTVTATLIDKLYPSMKLSGAVGFLSLYKCGLRTKDITMNYKLMRNVDSQDTHKTHYFLMMYK